MNKPTEDNELVFPPRPIVPKQDAIFSEVEEPKIDLVTINDITISPTLESLLQSLLGSILICHSQNEVMKGKVCEQCQTRIDKVERIRTQVKAEMVVLFDLRRKLNKYQDEVPVLRTFVDLHHGEGTAEQLMQEHRGQTIKRVK